MISFDNISNPFPYCPPFRLPMSHRFATNTPVLRLSILYASLLPCVSAGAAEMRALDSISATELADHVQVLADDSFEGREAGSRGGRAAAGYLVDFMRRHKLQPAGTNASYSQDFGGRYRNLLAMMPGSDKTLRDEYVLISAHYDHVGYGTRRNSYGPWGYIHNGADDNASGVAGVLELMEAISSYETPRRSILFAFWDGEEKGLLGSKHWTASPTIPLKQVRLMINLDMIGRLTDSGLKVFGTRTRSSSRRFVSQCNVGVDLPLDFTWELKDNSDHYSFLKRKVPVLMLHTGLHDDYHRPSDDAHKLNPEGMQRISKLLLNIVMANADAEELGTFREAGRAETVSRQRAMEAILARRVPRLGAAWRTVDDRVVIQRVNSGSAAARAGLRTGDQLLSLNGQVIDGDITNARLQKMVLLAPSPSSMVVERRGQTGPLDLTVHLHGNPVRIGISWREDAAEPGMLFVTRVAKGSAADEAGIQAGDRIYAMNGEQFANGEVFAKLSRDSKSPIELTVERRGLIRTVMVNTLPALSS